MLITKVIIKKLFTILQAFVVLFFCDFQIVKILISYLEYLSWLVLSASGFPWVAILFRANLFLFLTYSSEFRRRLPFVERISTTSITAHMNNNLK